MSCNLCDGNPRNAIMFDCGGCDMDEEEFCEECDELIDDCECEEE